jgi:ATP-dependent RNA helicase DDX23/PRP28
MFVLFASSLCDSTSLILSSIFDEKHHAVMSIKRGRTDYELTTEEESGRSVIPMTEEEEMEAKRMAEIAERAEAKALLRKREREGLCDNSISTSSNQAIGRGSGSDGPVKVAKFLSKKERQELALQKLQQKREDGEKKALDAKDGFKRFVTGQAQEERKRTAYLEREREEQEKLRRQREENKATVEQESEMRAIRDQYLGVKEKRKRVAKPSEKFARIFQFDWEAGDDTAKNDQNPLYNHRVKINPLFGRGYLAGIDLREQRKGSNYLEELSARRLAEVRRLEEADESLSNEERRERERERERLAKAQVQLQREQVAGGGGGGSGGGNGSSTGRVGAQRDKRGDKGLHWSEKQLEDMSERDWRIFREDFDIRIQGGRAPLPLRSWREAGLPLPVMQGIEAAGYKEPSPIQRQAIPIGKEGRDIMGIAETGSGKTAAFTLPLLHYLLSLPPGQVKRCDDEGPLAVIMAPTRELAQQIEEEVIKLAKFTDFKTVCVVGGQSIEEQGYILRKGVEIVIGTPGRMVDCIENNFLVLNQCNYVVLDEADRMIDMGFEGQVMQVLDAMGGLLKSEDESLLEQQVSEAAQGQAVYRVTAMFSATMSVEVERIAKTYLRHPAIIKIGDEDSGKNKRITQQVEYLGGEGQKKNKLMETLRRFGRDEKGIVFVNAKKNGDFVGRQLEAAGIRCGVLHSGRSQDQREDTLKQFRTGSIQVLVATDVAGRGLDISDVKFVLNYDMPNKIENYCHRIGRTGRAGKSGTAITLLTDADSDVMYDLKQYLEATGTPNIPQQLLRHPAAQNAMGTRDDQGKLMGQKKDAVMFAK